MWEIWAKIIVATGLDKLTKVQKIAQSDHTAGIPDNISIQHRMAIL